MIFDRNENREVIALLGAGSMGSDKTVIPFNTHEGSGQGGTQRTIEGLCSGAAVLDGLAIRGNTAQNDSNTTEQAVSEWLSGMDFFG